MTRIIIRIILAASTSLLVGCASLPLQPIKPHTQPPITAHTLAKTTARSEPLARPTGRAFLQRRVIPAAVGVGAER